MVKKLASVLATGAFVLAMSLPVATPARAQQAANPPAGKMGKMQHEGKEGHPEIRAAMNHLRQAKANLEHAAHDFGGHRQKALDHINEALEELRTAMQTDAK